MANSEFVEYVVYDQLAQLPGISVRSMFGGYGIYQEGVFVALVLHDELYIKSDESNKEEYIKMGSAPFQYKKKTGSVISMSYWKIPSEVLEDSERLVKLINDAYEINLKKMIKKPKKKKV